MKYDYLVLKQPAVISVLKKYLKTDEINIIQNNSNSGVIHLGNNMLFLVENDIIYYTGGLQKLTSDSIISLAQVMKKLQSVISLEAPVINREGG